MKFGRLATTMAAGVVGLVLLSGCAAVGAEPNTTEATVQVSTSTPTVVPTPVTSTPPIVDQKAVEQAAADEAARAAAAQAAADLYAAGWYDERGWVSPESAARARDAGIAAGGSVPDELRCGTVCGEPPTSVELREQSTADQDPMTPDGSLEAVPCDGYASGGTCYPSYEEAAAACGAYLIRGNCYPSAEAARAAGEGE